MDAQINACRVGILGTSLSAIDAAVAVVSQHGAFTTDADNTLHFTRNPGSQSLKLTLMSRSGVLPEADFYCPLPYEPLNIATGQAIEHVIEQGQRGLLDRLFLLIVKQLQDAAPQWSQQIALETLTADTFSDIYFADRIQHNPLTGRNATCRKSNATSGSNAPSRGAIPCCGCMRSSNRSCLILTMATENASSTVWHACLSITMRRSFGIHSPPAGAA